MLHQYQLVLDSIENSEYKQHILDNKVNKARCDICEKLFDFIGNSTLDICPWCQQEIEDIKRKAYKCCICSNVKEDKYSSYCDRCIIRLNEFIKQTSNEEITEDMICSIKSCQSCRSIKKSITSIKQVIDKKDCEIETNAPDNFLRKTELMCSRCTELKENNLICSKCLNEDKTWFSKPYLKFENYDYCYKHMKKCERYYCKNVVENKSITYCKEHKCKVEDCNKSNTDNIYCETHISKYLHFSVGCDNCEKAFYYADGESSSYCSECKEEYESFTYSLFECRFCSTIKEDENKSHCNKCLTRIKEFIMLRDNKITQDMIDTVTVCYACFLVNNSITSLDKVTDKFIDLDDEVHQNLIFNTEPMCNECITLIKNNSICIKCIIDYKEEIKKNNNFIHVPYLFFKKFENYDCCFDHIEKCNKEGCCNIPIQSKRYIQNINNVKYFCEKHFYERYP